MSIRLRSWIGTVLLIAGSIMFFLAKESPLFITGASVMGLGFLSMVWALVGLSRQFRESRSRLESSLLAEIEGGREQKRPPKRLD